MEILAVNFGNFRDAPLPAPHFPVHGSLGINTGRSFCKILAKKAKNIIMKEEAL